jgi:hypothetical protein
MPLPPGEPAAGPWRVEPLARVVETLLDRAGPVRGRPVVVAVETTCRWASRTAR